MLAFTATYFYILIKFIMKATILKTIFFFVIGTSTINAQQAAVQTPKMPIDEVTNLITYTDVVEEPGMNKDTLYNRALRWTKGFFKNPIDAVKKADAEARVIEGGYRFKISRPEPNSKKQPVPMVDAGLVNYKYKIFSKDGKFKYEITNFSWQQNSYYPLERWMDNKATNYDPNFALYLKQTDDFIKDLIKSLEKAIETDPVKKKDDW
jgi:hypothetical protein